MIARPIEAVGEVHRVAGAVDDEVGQRDETEHAQRVRRRLEEGHDQFELGRGVCGDPGIDRRGEGDRRGPRNFQRLASPFGSR